MRLSEGLGGEPREDFATLFSRPAEDRHIAPADLGIRIELLQDFRGRPCGGCKEAPARDGLTLGRTRNGKEKHQAGQDQKSHSKTSLGLTAEIMTSKA
jgi:hypothetical protein